MNYQNRSDARFFAQLSFWIALLLLIVASRSVIAFDAPTTVNEGEVLSITFVNGELHRDGTLVSMTSPYEWQTTNADAGLYEFTHYVNDSPVDTQTIEVLDVPLTFTIIQPAQTDYATNTIPIEIQTAQTVDFCYSVIGADSNTLDANGNTHTGEITKPDGIYTLALKCKLGTEVATQERTILIDTKPPAIIASSPETSATIADTDVTLSITTDEVATCTTEGTEMDSADHLTHTLVVSPGAGTHNYVVTCTDAHGNNANHTLSFTIDNIPTARIEIEDRESEETPLTAGSYEITLTASEPLQADPELTYVYQGGGGGTIALSRHDDAGTEWRGYLVLADDAGEKAGSFEISMRDTDDNLGTTITDGKLFLIDTLAPKQVTAVRVEAQKDDARSWLRVSWADDYPEDTTFRIYRSEYERVSKADYLDETRNDFYEDRFGKAGTTYYYAVAATDAAGNVGPLSVAAVNTLVPSERITDSPEQEFEIEQVRQKLSKAILDLETAKSTLEQERDPQRLLIIQEARLLTDVQSLLTTLTAGRDALEELAGVSDEEFLRRIAAINDAIVNVNSVIPTRISIDGSISYTQTGSTQTQGKILAKATSIFGSDAESLDDTRTRAAYQSEVQQLMDESQVNVQVVSAVITFANREEKGYTTISKQLVVPSHTTTILAIEHIPTELGDASTFTWKPEPIFLDDEALAQHELPPGENELSYAYTIPQRLDLVTARTVGSVLLPPLAAPRTNAVTGNAVLGGMNLQFSYVLGLLVIAGLLAYYFFTDPAKPQGLEGLTKAITALAARQQPVPPRSYYPPRTFFERRRLPPASSTIFPEIKEPREAPQLTVPELLAEGHQCIDDKEYVVAKQHYETVLPQLTDAKDQAAANLLYYKLLLYQKMQAATEAVHDEDNERLMRYLQELKSVAQKLPETDSQLITDAKEHFRSLSRSANKLAIKHDVY